MESSQAVRSAETLPEHEHAQTSTSSVRKRTGSEEIGQESKKQRTSSSGKTSANPVEDTKSEGTPGTNEELKPTDEPVQTNRPNATHDTRRKSSVQDEKGRARRLFGGLFGNAKQSDDRVTKRKGENAERKKAKLDEQAAARAERQQHRTELHHRNEQAKHAEHKMRARHSDMLHTANFLRTESSPRVYYRPWDLLPHEEDIIEDQIRDVKTKINKEASEYEKEKKEREEQALMRDAVNLQVSKTTGASGKEGNASDSSANGVEQSTQPNSTDQDASLVNTSNIKQSEMQDAHSIVPTHGDESSALQEKMDVDGDADSKEENDDDGDHIVEADEDTVIY